MIKRNQTWFFVITPSNCSTLSLYLFGISSFKPVREAKLDVVHLIKAEHQHSDLFYLEMAIMRLLLVK